MLETRRRCLAFCAIVSLFLSMAASRAVADGVFRVTDFGAVGDGQTMNTDAFARRAAACARLGASAWLCRRGHF